MNINCRKNAIKWFSRIGIILCCILLFADIWIVNQKKIEFIGEPYMTTGKDFIIIRAEVKNITDKNLSVNLYFNLINLSGFPFKELDTGVFDLTPFGTNEILIYYRCKNASGCIAAFKFSYARYYRA